MKKRHFVSLVTIVKDCLHAHSKANWDNKNVVETLYHAALERSNELSTERIPDMKTVKDYIDWEVNIFAKPTNDMCQTYMNVSQQDAPLFNRVRPILRETKIENPNWIGSYASFEGSPASKGILQFDMWKVTTSDRYDWDKLKNDIKMTGLRNSLLVAPMPTASTAQILGNNECFEPFTSNIYSRRNLARELVLAKKYLKSSTQKMDFQME